MCLCCKLIRSNSTINHLSNTSHRSEILDACFLQITTQNHSQNSTQYVSSGQFQYWFKPVIQLGYDDHLQQLHMTCSHTIWIHYYNHPPIKVNPIEWLCEEVVNWKQVAMYIVVAWIWWVSFCISAPDCLPNNQYHRMKLLENHIQLDYEFNFLFITGSLPQQGDAILGRWPMCADIHWMCMWSPSP